MTSSVALSAATAGGPLKPTVIARRDLRPDDTSDDPERWLAVHGEGSREGYRCPSFRGSDDAPKMATLSGSSSRARPSFPLAHCVTLGCTGSRIWSEQKQNKDVIAAGQIGRSA